MQGGAFHPFRSVLQTAVITYKKRQKKRTKNYNNINVLSNGEVPVSSSEHLDE